MCMYGAEISENKAAPCVSAAGMTALQLATCGRITIFLLGSPAISDSACPAPHFAASPAIGCMCPPILALLLCKKQHSIAVSQTSSCSSCSVGAASAAAVCVAFARSAITS